MLQCVVATNGTMTFSIFLYDELQWSKADESFIHAQVGFNDGKINTFNTHVLHEAQPI